MADSWTTSSDSQKPKVDNSEPKASNLKPPQVKFMFGDEDSDSGRSCSLSLSSSNKNTNSNSTKVSDSKNKATEKNIAESSKSNIQHKEKSDYDLQSNKSYSTDLCLSAGKDTSGFEVAKGGLAIAPSSPSTRVDNENAVGSPIHVTSTPVELSYTQTHQENDSLSSSKLPATAQFINSHVSSSRTLLNSPSRPQVQFSISPSTSKGAKIFSSIPNISVASPNSSEEVTESFSNTESPTTSHNINGSSSSGSTLLSRTQQKLFLQRQHTHTDDASSLLHPQNQSMFSKELERVNREYGWVRRHHNPVLESLQRVMVRRRLDTSQQH